MKHALTMLASILTLLFIGCNTASFDRKQAVNPVIGDISFESKFGHKPDASTDNELRVRTHLEYAENLLRGKDVSTLSPEQLRKRHHMLDLLHAYWTHGSFPKNYDYMDERKPCFIDRDGTICAVGYLVEQTAGRAVAQAIDSRHHYDAVLAMNDPQVDDWIKESGLTREECAIIQPTYGGTYYVNNSHIKPEYGISSAVVGGLNLSLNTLNAVQIRRGSSTKAISCIGILCGVGQIVLGAANIPKENSTSGSIQVNEGQKNLSYINIGLGTSTLLLSAWNLATHHKPKDRATSWNLYGFPAYDGNAGLAVCMTRRF